MPNHKRVELIRLVKWLMENFQSSSTLVLTKKSKDRTDIFDQVSEVIHGCHRGPSLVRNTNKEVSLFADTECRVELKAFCLKNDDEIFYHGDSYKLVLWHASALKELGVKMNEDYKQRFWDMVWKTMWHGPLLVHCSMRKSSQTAEYWLKRARKILELNDDVLRLENFTEIHCGSRMLIRFAALPIAQYKVRMEWFHHVVCDPNICQGVSHA
jgi:hypothetical protein